MAKATNAKKAATKAASKGKAAAKAAPDKTAKAVPIKKDSAPIKKGDKSSAKKTAVKAAAGASGSTGGSKLLELGLLLDCTSSMSTWIERSKKTLQEIISNVVSSTDGLKVRVCFVGYRDHCDTERFSISPFTEDIA